MKRKVGKRPSQLWLTPDNYALIKAAARLDGRPMTQFIKRATLKAAKELYDSELAKVQQCARDIGVAVPRSL